MTEDMLEEQAEILTQLGTSEEGARVRAQMQCASLLSDMEAFKVKDKDPKWAISEVHFYANQNHFHMKGFAGGLVRNRDAR